MKLPASAVRLATIFVVAAALAVLAFRGATSANNIPGTNVVDTNQASSPDDLKPVECNGISLTDKVSGSGTLMGTAGNDLVLGDGSGVTVDAGDGDDCIVGTPGDDTLSGGLGYDICIGNGGTDTFDPSCEETR